MFLSLTCYLSLPVLLCSEDFGPHSPRRFQHRPIRVRGLDAVGASTVIHMNRACRASRRAKPYALAGLSPERNRHREVHDASAFSEIYQAEMLVLHLTARGGAYVESGGDGRLAGAAFQPIWWELVSKGHPVGATRPFDDYELGPPACAAKRGRRQAANARIALLEKRRRRYPVSTKAACFRRNP